MFEITRSSSNKDLLDGETYHEAQERYLELHGSFKSRLPKPAFYPSPERDDIFILDFAKSPYGLKAYGAEKYIAELEKETIGYAAPRVGHASEAIAMLCEMYGKTGVFFAPASRDVSAHQAVVTAYDWCELRFAKIPAMKTMNSWIRQWANKFGCIAIPFGLSGIPEVTAGLVSMCDDHTIRHGKPSEFYCSVSTGTMIRALQIGWPNSAAYGIQVARNLKDGEKGKAVVDSYHLDFYSKSDRMPKFETTATYDAKAYDMFLDIAGSGSIFINVGSDKQIENRLKKIPNWENIDSRRDWGDMGAFDHA